MSTLDFAIVIFYVLFIIWRGFHERRKHSTTDDFFLADRTLSWPMIGLSLYATNISISSIIGLAGSGYETGISVFNYEWTGSIILIVFAILIIPYYLRHKLVTMPEFLERRFDQRSRIYFSVISIAINIIIDIAGALYASSLFLKGIFPQVDLIIFVIGMAIVTGLYTMVGGLRAVVITDSIQAILLTLGSAVIAGIVFMNVGSWSEIQQQIPADFFSLIRPLDDDFIPWPTLFVSLPILGFYFACSNQHMVQRILGAKSIDHGRKGAIFAAALKLPLLFILVLPGTLGRIIYPEIENSNLIFPELMFDFLPAGILGIVLTGFVAALMSSIDSALTAASSIATMDLYKKARPESSQEHLVFVGKAFILIAVFIASLWAPFINRFPTLWEYLQAVLSYMSPPVVTCFIFGLFWKYATPNAAFYSLLIGGVTGLLLVFNNYFYPVFDPIHYLYSATIIFMISSSVMIFFSLLEEKKEAHPIPTGVWKLSLTGTLSISAQLPWYKGYQFYAMLVCIITFLIVFIFR